MTASYQSAVGRRIATADERVVHLGSRAAMWINTVITAARERDF